MGGTWAQLRLPLARIGEENVQLVMMRERGENFAVVEMLRVAGANRGSAGYTIQSLVDNGTIRDVTRRTHHPSSSTHGTHHTPDTSHSTHITPRVREMRLRGCRVVFVGAVGGNPGELLPRPLLPQLF